MKTDKKEIICISCPAGCHLTISKKNDDWEVTGNKCPKGKTYGIEEVTAPKRTVTYVVKTDSDYLPYIPVRTDKPLPKEMIDSLIKQLKKKISSIPITRGDTLINDFQQTGVNVIFSRSFRGVGAETPEGCPVLTPNGN